jgi:hypothetical protein
VCVCECTVEFLKMLFRDVRVSEGASGWVGK